MSFVLFGISLQSFQIGNNRQRQFNPDGHYCVPSSDFSKSAICRNEGEGWEFRTRIPVGTPTNHDDGPSMTTSGTNTGAAERDRQTEEENTRIIAATEIRRIENLLAQWCRTTSSDAERRLLDDAEDGDLKEFDLLSAAMIAGGSAPEKVEQLVERFRNQLMRIQSRLDPGASPLVRLQQAFRGLHSEILHGGYHINASNPGEAIQTGRFNCVSATILFKLIAESTGFEAKVLQSPTHAYCVVKCGDHWVPVECTCPTWFDSLADRSPTDSWQETGSLGHSPHSTGSLGHPMVSKSQRANRTLGQEVGRDISNTQLLGTIYYNRGVACLLDRKYEVAVVTNLRAIQLDPVSQPAQDNLLASLNNWAISLAERGEFAEAAARLHLALECRPDSQPIQANLYRVYREWKNHLQRQGKDPEANFQINRSIQSLPADGRCAGLRGKLQTLLNQ